MVDGQPRPSLNSELPDHDYDRELVQRLALHGWPAVIGDLSLHAGKSSSPPGKKSGFSVKCERLADAFTPFAAVDRSEGVMKQLRTDIANLVLINPNDKFSKRLLYCMQISSQIHQVFVSQFRLADSFCDSTNAPANSEGRGEHPETALAGSGSPPGLGIKYAISVLLLLVESIQKNEPVILKDVLLMISDLLRGTNSRDLIEDLQNVQGSKWIEPLFTFFDRIIRCGSKPGNIDEQELAAFILVKLSVMSGSIRWILSSLESLLLLSGRAPLCLGEEFLNMVVDLHVSLGCNRDPGSPTQFLSRMSLDRSSGPGENGLIHSPDCLPSKPASSHGAGCFEDIALILLLEFQKCLCDSFPSIDPFSIVIETRPSTSSNYFRKFADEVPSETLSLFATFIKLAYERFLTSQDLRYGQILLCSVKILRTHIFQMSASVRIKTAINSSDSDAIRSILANLIFSEIKEKSQEVNIFSEVQLEASRTMALGLELLFPSIPDQLDYILQMLKTQDDPRSESNPAEKHLIQLVYARLASVGYARDVMLHINTISDLENDANGLVLLSTMARKYLTRFDVALEQIINGTEPKVESQFISLALNVLQPCFLSRILDLLEPDRTRYDLHSFNASMLISKLVDYFKLWIDGAITTLKKAHSLPISVLAEIDLFMCDRLFLRMIHPLLVFLLTLPLSMRASFSLYISDALTDFLRAISSLRSAVLASSMPRKTVKTQIVESTHPYQGNSSTIQVIRIGKCNSVEIKFDSRSRTTDQLDVVEVYFGEGSTKQKIGYFCEERWHGPKLPIKPAASSLTVCIHARSSNPPSWGYGLKIVATTKCTPFAWLHELARYAAILCGNLAGAVLDGFGITEEETGSRYWLEAGLINGSFESLDPSSRKFVDSITVADIPVQSPAAPYHSADPDEMEFLKQIESNTGRGAILIRKLNTFASFTFPIPKSIKPLAELATRVVFAVLLKHTAKIDQAIGYAMETPIIRPDDCILRLWRKSNEMEGIFATRFGQGYERNAILDQILKKSHFLLSISVSKPTISLLSLTRQSSGSMSHLFPVLLRGNSSSRNTMRRALKAMRILKDDHQFGAVSPDKSENLSWPAVKDPDSQICKLVLQFIEDQSIDVDALIRSVIRHRSRAVLRCFAIERFHSALKAINCSDLRRDMVHFFGQSLCRRHDPISSYSVDIADPATHLISGTECAGKFLQDKLLSSYYGLISTLITSFSGPSEALLIMNLMNCKLHHADIEHLHKIGAVRFLKPMLTHISSSKWKIRYAAWSLFRLFAYSSAKTPSHDQDAPSESFDAFQLEVLDVIFGQLQSLQKSRIQTVLSTTNFEDEAFFQPLLACADSWSCKACTFLNDRSAEHCLACGSPSGSKEKPFALWPCHRCTFLNKSALDICAICDAHRKPNAIVLESDALPTHPSKSAASLKIDQLKRLESIAKFQGREDNSTYYWQQAPSVILFGDNVMEPTTAIFGDISATVFSEEEIRYHFFAHVDSDFSELKIGVAMDTSDNPSSIMYDAVTGNILNGCEVLSTGEPYGRGDVITVQTLSDSVIFFKNYVIQGNRIRGVSFPFFAAASSRNCTVSLVGRNSFIRRSSDWNARAQKMSLEIASVAWFAIEHAELGENGTRHACSNECSIEELDLLTNQFLWVLSRCCSDASFQRGICHPEWVRVIVRMVTDPRSNPITRTLALRICRSIFPLMAPSSDIIHATVPESRDLIEYFIGFIGESSLSLNGPCNYFALWSASEMVALIRFLWLDDSWSPIISNFLRRAIQSFPGIFQDVKSKLLVSESDVLDSITSRQLAFCFGALHILGAWIEPLREGSRVLFSSNGTSHEGVVSSYHSKPFRMVIDAGSQLIDAFEVKNANELASYRVQAISEVDVLPETMCHISGVVLEIMNFLSLNEDTKAQPLLLLQAQIKRMASRVIQQTLQNGKVLNSVIKNPGLFPILALAVTPSAQKPLNSILKLESRYLWLCNLYKPGVASQSDHAENDDKSTSSILEYPKSHAASRSVGGPGGQIVAFGKGDNGRLGLGNNSSAFVPTLVPVFGPVHNAVIAVSCFSSHIVALTNLGVPYSWGKGDDGRLGHGGTTPESSPRLIKAMEGTRCVQVCAGLNFSFVLDENGSLWGFGSNANGQIGIGAFPSQMTPIRVKGDLEDNVVSKVSAGGSHVLAITCNGKLFTWGKNVFGQLGHGTTQKLSTPKLVKSAESLQFVLIAGGWEHSMAVTADGRLYSWGAGYEGNRPVCGHGSNEKELVPRQVDGLAGEVVVHIAAGWDHSLAITNEGKLYTWGHGNCGMLGHGTVSPASVPTLVEGALRTEKCVWADGGQDHTIVVTARGQIWVFGSGGAHAGTDIATAIHEPQLIKDTPLGMVFGAVCCGDKCTFLLSSQIPRTVPSKPMLQHSGLTPLPLYPLRLHFCGDHQSFVSPDGFINEFVFGRSAVFETRNSSEQAVASDEAFIDKILLDIEAVELNLSSLSLSVCVNLSGKSVTTLLSLSSGDHDFKVSLNDGRLMLSFDSDLCEAQVDLNDGDWHNIIIVGNGKIVELFVGGASVWSKTFDEVQFTISNLSVGPIKGSIRDLALWDVPLTTGQIVSVVNSGMAFVISDLQIDEVHRQSWRLVDFSPGPDSILDINRVEPIRTMIGRSKISVEGPYEFMQDDKGFFITLPGNSALHWTNPWNVENTPFTVVMEIKIHSDEDVALFSTLDDPSAHVIWTRDGRFQISESSTDVKCLIVWNSMAAEPPQISPVDRHLWNRIVITSENDPSNRISIFINGFLSGALNCINPIYLKQGLIFLPPRDRENTTVSVRFVEVHKSCLTIRDITDLGSASDPIISSALVSSISGTLQQIGFPPSWVHRAMYRCRFHRYHACKWILNNEALLRKEDAMNKLHEDAYCLNIMGIPFGDCSEALQSHDGDYISALSHLMKGDSFYLPTSSSSVSKHNHEPFKDFTIADDESVILENPAYRILASSAEGWQEASTTPTSDTSDSSAASDTTLSGAKVVSEMVRLDSKLTVAYSRHAVLGIIRHLVDGGAYDSFSLQHIGGLEFFAKFLRLTAFMHLQDALSVLKELAIHLLNKEMGAWASSGNRSAIPELSRFLVHDCLVHLIGFCLKPNINIENEQMALDNPNHEIGLWYLDIFVRTHRRAMSLSDLNSQEFVTKYLLCPSVINVVLKMLSITRGQPRLQFLLVLSHLVKTGVAFDESKSAFLKKQLFVMHDRFKDNRIFPSFFQALLELVLLLDQPNTLPLPNTPLWYQQFSELRELLRVFLEPDRHKRSAWPPIFSDYVMESLNRCREVQNVENLVEQVQRNGVEFDMECDLELILCLNRILASWPSSHPIPQLMPTQDQLISFERLSHRHLNSIHIRCAILYQLNDVIASAMPLINLSRTDEESELSCMLRRARGLIFPITKNALWFEVLNRTASDVQVVGMSRDLKVSVNRFSASSWKEHHRVDMKGTKTCFGQVFHQVHHLNPSILRLRREERAWKTVFQGEFSDDYGGPYRNCLDLLCEELQSSYLPLFIPCPNQRSRIGFNQDKFVPNPASTLPLHISMYEFVGKLMGIAIRSRNLLNLNLPSIVWKSLVSETISDEDVVEIDAVAFRVITNIRRMEADDQITAEDFEEILSMTFSVSGSDGQEVDLIPDGSVTPVTWQNKNEFIAALAEFRKNEFRLQCDAIRRGLSSIVPFPMLSLFTWKEFELQVCGHAHIDVELLKSMTQYEWCSPSDPHICAFWEVLSDLFDDAQRSDFLKFVWGRSRLPVNVNDFDCKFKISNMPRARQDPDTYLPISHTCFFSIELPRYTSKQILHRRLLYAITHCISIDADSTSAAQSSARMISTNLSDDDMN